MKHRALSYPKLLAGGFLLMILCGAVLLSLPISSKSGEYTPFLTSLFTATSASCVTGLVLVDTYLHWSVFGQLVILLMIQIGGIGFMTLMTAFSLALHRSISLRERTLLKENFNMPEIGGMVRLTKRILCGTLLIELCGAVILSACLIPSLGVGEGVYTAVFVSISAFCNAGFDLFGRYGAFTSLVPFAGNAVFMLAVSLLILIGGIGFIVWDDVLRHRFRFRKYRLHSKIALCTTALITVVATVLFLVLERDSTGADMPFAKQLLHAFFDSVTPRTAGFNAVEISEMAPASKLLSIFLMMVGGSPGSTAGGLKTVTVAVLLICALSNLRRRSGYNVFGRRLPRDVLDNAVSVLMTYVTVLTVGVTVVCALQTEQSFLDILLECVSALSTVGITAGITRDLLPASQLVLILMMFCGRIGSLSFAMVFMQKQRREIALSPEETVGVG
ncbi:MAG: Trk family potassium uptake protein [Clostridia bacterium]|nr:Trk family potassium uptake protein [Clostridia bacterium]